MRLALVQPRGRTYGGAERVFNRVAAELEKRGHIADRVFVDLDAIWATGREAFDVDVPAEVIQLSPTFFEYLKQVELFGLIDLSRFDAAISTIPPSFALNHPRHLSLFYHHARIFYDLSELFVGAGFVQPDVHSVAQAGIRVLDQRYLERVGHFMVPSTTVRRRLSHYSSVKVGMSLFQAGPGLDLASIDRAPAGGGAGHALCITRHSFPKRGELFVHAMKFLPEVRGVLAGSGERLNWAIDLDARLACGSLDIEAAGPRDLWLNPGYLPLPASPPASSNVRFMTKLSDHELSRSIGTSLCVVAPAYMEDYGLTAIEAMLHHKPVIVCRDGGGLTELVEDGVEGLVVEPEGRAIAGAIRKLADDPGLARSMGEAGWGKARHFTWERAIDQLLAGIDSLFGTRTETALNLQHVLREIEKAAGDRRTSGALPSGLEEDLAHQFSELLSRD